MVKLKLKWLIIFSLIILSIIIYASINDVNSKGVNLVGAYGNDQKDDTRAIQQVLNSKKKIVFFPKGKYYISSILKIKHPVTIIGNKATLILNKKYRLKNIQGFFYAKSINHIKIKNIIFDGNKNNLRRGKINNVVAWFENSSNDKIENCHVFNLNGKGKNLNTAFGFIGSSNNIKIYNNVIKDSDSGAVFFQGQNSIAFGNVARNLKDVALVANGENAKKITFQKNYIINTTSGSIGIENGPSDIKIFNNFIKNLKNGYGIGIVTLLDTSGIVSKNILIKNNEISNNLGTVPCQAIGADKGTNIIIEDNKISHINNNNPNNVGIWIGSDASNTIIKSNKIIQTTSVPISINSDTAINENNRVIK